MSTGFDPILDMLGKMEPLPDVGGDHNFYPLVSIAISLKRIADAIEVLAIETEMSGQ